MRANHAEKTPRPEPTGLGLEQPTWSRRGEQIGPSGGVEEAFCHAFQPLPVLDRADRGLRDWSCRPESFLGHLEEQVLGFLSSTRGWS